MNKLNSILGSESSIVMAKNLSCPNALLQKVFVIQTLLELPFGDVCADFALQESRPQIGMA